MHVLPPISLRASFIFLVTDSDAALSKASFTVSGSLGSSSSAAFLICSAGVSVFTMGVG